MVGASRFGEPVAVIALQHDRYGLADVHPRESKIGICYESSSVTLTCTDEQSGKVDHELLHRDGEPRLKVVAARRAWSTDADGNLFRLVSEAQLADLARRRPRRGQDDHGRIALQRADHPR